MFYVSKKFYYAFLSVWLIGVIYLMIINKMQREGMVDSEKLFYVLLGSYPSYHFQENLVKEVSLNTYATVNISEISTSDINTKLSYLQKNGWRKVFSDEKILRLCHGNQNMLIITQSDKNPKLEQDHRFKGKVKLSFLYEYRGVGECE